MSYVDTSIRDLQPGELIHPWHTPEIILEVMEAFTVRDYKFYCCENVKTGKAVYLYWQGIKRVPPLTALGAQA